MLQTQNKTPPHRFPPAMKQYRAIETAPPQTTPPLSTSSSGESSPMSNFSASSLSNFVTSGILHHIQSKKEGFQEDETTLALDIPSSTPPSSPRYNLDSNSGSPSRSSSSSPSRVPRTPISHASRSNPSSPSGSFAREHTLQQHSRTLPRYRPYPLRGGLTPLELRFAARTTGPSSYLNMTVDDVEEGKDVLQAALVKYPQELLVKAYEAKRADRDTIVHRVAQTVSEIEALERHRMFLSALQHHQENQLAAEESLLDVVMNTLSPRTLEEVEDDSGYYRAVFAEELVSLTVADSQANCVGEVAEPPN